MALIDVGISEYYSNSTYLYTNNNEIEANNIDDDGNGYVDDINGWNVIDNNGNYDSSNIITVAAASNNGEIDYSSNYRKQYVDIAASGENIVCYLGNSYFVYEGGNSLAQPLVYKRLGLFIVRHGRALTGVSPEHAQIVGSV